MTSTFWIPGKPGVKQRPRFARMGSFTKVYTPKETVAYEALVKLAAVEAGIEMIAEGPVEVVIDAYWPSKKPPRKSNPRKLERHAVRPDADQVLKIVLDGLDKVAYSDDGQVAVATIRKWRAAQGQEPGVKVRIHRLVLQPYTVDRDLRV